MITIECHSRTLFRLVGSGYPSFNFPFYVFFLVFSLSFPFHSGDKTIIDTIIRATGYPVGSIRGDIGNQLQQLNLLRGDVMSLSKRADIPFFKLCYWRTEDFNFNKLSQKIQTQTEGFYIFLFKISGVLAFVIIYLTNFESLSPAQLSQNFS